MPPLTLEICANSFQSALNAEKGDAQRIELCQNLDQGGTTPSRGLIKHCLRKLIIPIYVLVRPRPGDFVYSEDEMQIMIDDIKSCQGISHGIRGIVIGALTKDKRVDMVQCRRLMAVAPDIDVTFHRAFDECEDLFEALENVIELGCSRILTSGGKDTALGGVEVIAELVRRANGRIKIMAGAGINASNVRKLLQITGTDIDVHASATEILPTPTVTGRFDVVQRETSEKAVAALAEELAKIEKGF